MSRIIILTSNYLRHQYVVQSLIDALDVCGVWQEEKSFVPESYAGSEDDRRVIRAHFDARDRSEEQYFGAFHTLRLSQGTVHHTLPAGSINLPDEVRMMQELNPDVVVVFGTGILKEQLIQAFAGNIVNLHLGLSPYYRGSGTNFWPLVNREPEYVGATIHYLDAGIDSGHMICHVRPDIAAGDGPHDLGNKTIQKALEVFPAVLRAHAAGTVAARPQSGEGKLYLRKHFNADAVRRLYKNFQSGMIEEYLASKEERDRALTLLSPPEA